ncbi:MAG: acyl-CoA dehydrogenase family protein [Pseudomonadota bacterium]|uniref:acyl-CoA dehydrogenase family protein n=1 Tax=Phenylobacterium sp. TaxID=1871053 RepID=UPI0025E4FD47|nr:acyl-CoA dehydrogenase family protein [Phenylobacterium sp.]MBT9473400.1 acyl-CoA dehydrogenase family protein [Phenylobacterium sp.]
MTSQNNFREEVRAWLNENAPDALKGTSAGMLDGVWGGRRWQFRSAAEKQWLERMAGRGWTAPSWPKEYGGGGLLPEQAQILSEEMKSFRLPPPLVGFGLAMIGPVLLRFGTEEQKARHLPAICRGEIRWCQGYSEPGAGSDLASLQTRAVREGDHFIINGTKLWTSGADRSEWMFALVRTDQSPSARQKGITFILIDMSDPGVAASPIRLISGESDFCETYLTDVRVPVENVVHEIGEGWTVAKALLGHERIMIAEETGAHKNSGGAIPADVELTSLAKTHLGEIAGRIGDQVVRDQVAAIEMDSCAISLTVQRTRDAELAGQAMGPESSIFKAYGTELSQRRNELKMHILGPQSVGEGGPGFDADDLEATLAWLKSKAETIGGGTTEIQLNVIAKRVLGLPD